jgi:hypothetical protein
MAYVKVEVIVEARDARDADQRVLNVLPGALYVAANHFRWPEATPATRAARTGRLSVNDPALLSKPRKQSCECGIDFVCGFCEES